jgi:predicted ATPase
MVHLFDQKQIGVTINKKGLEDISVVNEGYGTNQIIQLITTLVIVPVNSVILIEEPEIHLHPKAQIDLVENIIDISLKENKQIIMTTHSENILFRILSLIKEKRISIDDVSIIHFNYENNVTKTEQLEINEFGQVKGGLRSFFDVQIDQFNKMLPKISNKRVD